MNKSTITSVTYTEHIPCSSEKCELSDETIYDVLKGIEENRYPFEMFRSTSNTPQITPAQIAVIAGALQYIYSPRNVEPNLPEHWSLQQPHLPKLRWQITPSGHRFMSIYATLQQTIQRIDLLEERLSILEAANLKQQ